MIRGTGIDILNIDRINKFDKNKLLHRIFSKDEINYINDKNNSITTIAGMFSAKEAVSKMLGTGIRDFKWKDIIILHDDLNKPYVQLQRMAKSIAETKGIKNISLTISHEKSYSVAIAIGEDTNNMSTYIPEEIKGLLPKRENNSHKGTYGRVGIIAGSIGMTGASYLASMAALRAGSGLVYLYTPKSLNTILETKTVEAITIPLEDDNKGFFIKKSYQDINDLSNLDVLVIGPGIGQKQETKEFIINVINKYKGNLVVDADAINLLVDDTDILKGQKGITIITPHPGELSRLIKVDVNEIQKKRIEYAIETSKRLDVITVLKGHNTIVTDGEKTYINQTGNPGMATAGSGDVLTGIIAAYIAQGVEVFNSCKASVYTHGLAGDYAKGKMGEYSMIATDIINNLSEAIKYIRRNDDEG
ncbi:NAD(P)H-hydrate dehydratase [Clostridium sp. D2Q-11]|uniref:Multifunctional fusion protein n=1 Tax=Anaeromonas frigoriresistens TaxID=2683708 RepID=A0A942UXI3_9FIRM|nr:NAD(P)H-hydrate dehydratase [Anaeromonas frigoriresistens]MBS4537432.1 NAD(P)H-hydrate dehydratase [Anaeromonas frigoriresistens]